MTATPDGRYLVIGGRRWRATDPSLPDDVVEALQSELGRARSGIGAATDERRISSLRDRVQTAKEGLGERGTPWWELDERDRLERASTALEHLRAEHGDPGSSPEDA